MISRYPATLSLAVGLLLSACTPSTLTPVSNADMRRYQGKATLLIAVDGRDDRKVRHLELSTAEEPEGHGLISLQIPAPSHDLHLKEYSLTGMYGCSRGKAGYGSGGKHIDTLLKHIDTLLPGKTYFLGTINTGMNTTYKEMPLSLRKEAKEKYGYTPHGDDLGNHKVF